MDVLLGVALGGMLTLSSFVLGMGSTYVLLRGWPKKTHPQQEILPPQVEHPDLDEVVFPSLEGLKPPLPDESWAGGDIGPPLGASDDQVLATYQELQQNLLAGKNYPEWLPDYWHDEWTPR